MVKGQPRTVPGNRGQLRLKGNIEQQQRRRRAPLLGDARFRIIQRNRQKLTDAREKLAEIAKQHDARLKLDKLRQVRLKVGTDCVILVFVVTPPRVEEQNNIQYISIHTVVFLMCNFHSFLKSQSLRKFY